MINKITNNITIRDKGTPQVFRLVDFVGKRLQLIQQPDGCTTSMYPVLVGDYYEITGTGGCVFEVSIPNYGTGLLHYERFDLQSPQ